MKTLLKWVLRLFMLGIVLIVVLVLSLNSILKASITRQIRAQTGMDVKIGRLSAGVLSPVVTLEDFRLYNPAEFGGGPFLNIRELHLEYSRAPLDRRTVHLKLLRLNIAEMTIVKNDSGRTNLAIVQPKPATASPRPEEWIFTGVDVLNLSVSTIHFIDLKNPRHNRDLNPRILNQVFKNVKSSEDLYSILVMVWLRSGGVVVSAKHESPLADETQIICRQIFTLNCSPFLSESAKPASNCGICSRSFRLTTSTGECM